MEADTATRFKLHALRHRRITSPDGRCLGGGWHDS